MRRPIVILSLMIGMSLTTISCGNDADGDSSSDSDSDTDTDSDTDSDTDTDTDTDSDTDGDTDQDIGSSCSCEGDGCEQALVNVPIPNGGTIIGCDEVQMDMPGTEPVCLRSYEGNYATNTYFANGYCSLMSTLCEGDSTICDSAVFGDYESMKACPSGKVLVMYSVDVQVEIIPGSVLEATIDNKTCTRSCELASECRNKEYDSDLDEPTQYDCIDKEGTKFCFDARNLPSKYQVEQF